MDLTKIITTTTPTGTENEAPPATTQPNNRKSLSFTNGALKKRPPHHHHHHPTQPPDAAVVYKECLKNHAAALGGHAVDGCGEFMPSPSSDPTDPTSLTCAACGCHRNFHRREDDSTAITTLFPPLQPPKPPRRSSPSSSPSPSPPPPPHPQPSYYSSAPRMLLALSTAVPDNHTVATPATPTAAKAEENPSGRKRFRTKFTQDQKEKMFSFSEKLGWKMQKSDEGLVEEFCNGIGVGKGVLKVWMHNNKHTFGKREINSSDSNGRSVLEFGNNGNKISAAKIITSDDNSHNHDNHNGGNNGFHLHVSTSGSPSST